MNKKSLITFIALGLLVLVPGFQNCGEAPLQNDYSLEDLSSMSGQNVSGTVDSDPIDDVSGLCGADKVVVNMIQNEPVCINTYSFSNSYCPFGLVAIRQDGANVTCSDWAEYSAQTVCPLGQILTGVKESGIPVCSEFYSGWSVGEQNFSRGRNFNSVKVQAKFVVQDFYPVNFTCPPGEILEVGVDKPACRKPRFKIDLIESLSCPDGGFVVGIKDWNIPVCQSPIEVTSSLSVNCPVGHFLAGVVGGAPVCTPFVMDEDFTTACPPNRGLHHSIGGKLYCASVLGNQALPSACGPNRYLSGYNAGQPICTSKGPSGFSKACALGEYQSGIANHEIVCSPFDMVLMQAQ